MLEAQPDPSESALKKTSLKFTMTVKSVAATSNPKTLKQDLVEWSKAKDIIISNNL